MLQDFLLRKRVDAVIAVALALTEDEIGQMLAIHRPLVGIGGPLPGASTIRIDDHGLAESAVNHLIRLGHSRIAHITGDSVYEQDFKIPRTRRAGYEKAMSGRRTPGAAVSGWSGQTSPSRAPTPWHGTCSAELRNGQRPSLLPQMRWP